MNMRFERNERYINGNIQIEHSVIAFNETKPSETYFLSIDGEEKPLSANEFGRLCEICEAVRAHDSEA